MGFLPNVKYIRKEDLGSEAPSWIDNLLSPLNKYLESVYTLLDGNVSLVDNIDCKIFEYTFTTESNYSSGGWKNIQFQKGVNSKVNLVLLGYITPGGTTAKSVDWYMNSDNVIISYISGLANNTKYTVRLLII